MRNNRLYISLPCDIYSGAKSGHQYTLGNKQQICQASNWGRGKVTVKYGFDFDEWEKRLNKEH